MTEARDPKRCSTCGAAFSCGATSTAPCWCAALPPLATLDPQADCLCAACLERALRQSAASA